MIRNVDIEQYLHGTEVDEVVPSLRLIRDHLTSLDPEGWYDRTIHDIDLVIASLYKEFVDKQAELELD